MLHTPRCLGTVAPCQREMLRAYSADKMDSDQRAGERSWKPILDGIVKELDPQAHFVPMILLFHRIPQRRLSGALNQHGAGGATNRLTLPSRRVGLRRAHRASNPAGPRLPYEGRQFDGVGFSSNLQLTPATRERFSSTASVSVSTCRSQKAAGIADFRPRDFDHANV